MRATWDQPAGCGAMKAWERGRPGLLVRGPAAYSSGAIRSSSGRGRDPGDVPVGGASPGHRSGGGSRKGFRRVVVSETLTMDPAEATSTPMALDLSALPDRLDALKAADVDDRIRAAAPGF